MKGTLLELIEPRGFLEDRKTAFVFWDGERWPWYLGKLSYRGLRNKARRIAWSLTNELTLKPGERLAVMLPNMPQFPVAYFGAFMAGLIVVPINPRYAETPAEILKILKDSGAEAIVVLDRFLPALEVIKKDTELRHIIVTTPADSLPLVKKLVYWIKTLWRGKYFYYPYKERPEIESYAALAATGFGKKFKRDTYPTDIALIIYTSGTTGAPKGVEMTHEALLENAAACKAYLFEMGLKSGEEIFLAAVPYFHILGIAALLNTALLVRAKTVLIPDPRKIPKILDAIDFTKTTAFAGMPGHYEVMAKLLAAGAKRRYLSSVKLWINGGAKLHKIHREKFEKLVGKKIRNGYGMTELGIVSCQKLGDEDEDSVGEPFSKVETAILNPDSEGKGELLVKSSGMMRGYWQQDLLTSEFMAARFFRTGDFAQFSSLGRSFTILLRGRKKYLIKTRTGENVDPMEIEKILMVHPSVVEAAVVGVADEKHGERIRACIVLRDPDGSCQEIFKKNIKKHCGDHLASFKVPDEIVCVREIEKNAAGKVLYEKLKELKASS